MTTSGRIGESLESGLTPWYLSRFIMRQMEAREPEGEAEYLAPVGGGDGSIGGVEKKAVEREPKGTTPEQETDVLIPLVTAGASFIVLVALVASLILFKRRRKPEASSTATSGSSIVVYPSQQGTAPQFLTKEIHFSLPTMRHAASLGDLERPDDELCDVEVETDALVTHAHRSNSFSSYGLGVIDPALYHGSLDPDEDLQFPEGHRGRVWFTLRYEPATEKLQVALLKLKNLPSRTVGTVNSCDPYVRLHLIPDERRYLQSRQKKKTCNPYFDETFVFQISSKEIAEHNLQLSVMDAGRTKRRAVIGHVTVALRGLPDDGTSDEPTLYKMDLQKEAQESVSQEGGELLVSLLYNENIHRLTVTVIEARNVKMRKDERRDTYVRVTLNQHYRAVKVKRTAAVRSVDSGDATNFSESFNFRVAAAQSDVTSVTLQLLQTVTGYGRDKLIGKCVLGSYMFARGKALTHWNTSFASPMEHVQQWHALCQ